MSSSSSLEEEEALDSVQLRNFRCMTAHQEPPESSVPRIPKGTLFRSANVDKVDQRTLAFLRDELNIRTIVDLRNYPQPGESLLSTEYKAVELDNLARERQRSPNQRLHVFIPFINGKYVAEILSRQPVTMYPTIFTWLFRYLVLKDTTLVRTVGEVAVQPYGLVQNYIDFLESGKDVVRTVLQILSEPQNLPAIICCRHGKDRTGIMSSIIRHITGANLHEICLDYQYTDIHLNRPNVRKEVEKDLFDEVGVDASFATAEKETMFEVFLWLKETYGSMDKYLDSAGVDAAMRKRIRETLGSKYMDIPNVTPS